MIDIKDIMYPPVVLVIDVLMESVREVDEETMQQQGQNMSTTDSVVWREGEEEDEPHKPEKGHEQNVAVHRGVNEVNMILPLILLDLARSEVVLDQHLLDVLLL